MAAIGIYGVTSRAVSERTRELGVRLALGASADGVARLVIWQALRAVLAGLAVGRDDRRGGLVTIARTLPNIENAEPWTAVPVLAVLLDCRGDGCRRDSGARAMCARSDARAARRLARNSRNPCEFRALSSQRRFSATCGEIQWP